jgi:HEAT repeat protein
MTTRMFMTAGLLGMLCPACFAGRSDSQNVHGTAYGRTTEQALREYHVGTTRAALIAALQGSEPEVRPLAARKLIEDHVQDAIPLVEAALSTEGAPKVKIRIAFALAEVGDGAGFSGLQNACDDRALEMIDRVEAARYLLSMGRESCLGAITEALQSKDLGGSNSREVALSLVPGFKHLSGADSQSLFSLVLRSLAGGDAATRVSASETLKYSGRVSAIPELQSAIRSEADDSVRSVMRADLSALLELREKGTQ